MKLSFFGRMAMALFASLVIGLGMTACGGGTVGYIWVLGQQYNQIGGFKVDDYTGNLTQVVGSPFASNGANPVSLVIKPGGRYLYVVNQGTVGTCATCGNTAQSGVGASIAVYAVGGDGVLTFQETYVPQGYIPIWAQFDPTGTYLYVLTQYSPGFVAGSGLWTGPNTDGNGAVTVFQSDPNTGRLSLVTNSQTQKNNVNTPFFEVGANPLMMKVAGGCLYTVDSADQSIFPLGISGNQLTFTTTGKFFPNPGTASISSITSNGNFVVLTDSTADNIRMFTSASGCNLVPTNGGGLTSNAQGLDPVWSLIDSTGKYLYVLNYFTPPGTVTQPNSTISAYTINPVNQQLQPISGAPYTTGSGPVCMVEDSSNQYMYVSNHNDGTVTGKVIDPATGILSNLSRGQTFPAVGNAECLVLSGNVE